MTDQRMRTPTNLMWAPRPGWATVRLVGTCADQLAFMPYGYFNCRGFFDDGPE